MIANRTTANTISTPICIIGPIAHRIALTIICRLAMPEMSFSGRRMRIVRRPVRSSEPVSNGSIVINLRRFDWQAALTRW